MKDEHIKALINEALQRENSQQTKALQKERAMRMQMYKDSIINAILGAILSLVPLVILVWAGVIFNISTFISGVFVTLWEVMTALVMYMSIKEDNETREERVNEMLQVK